MELMINPGLYGPGINFFDSGGICYDKISWLAKANTDTFRLPIINIAEARAIG